MTEIEEYLKSHFGINKSNLSEVGDLFEYKEIAKGEFILKTGQRCQSMNFLKEGFLRIFAATQNGDKEITQWISTKGNFVTDLSSFMFHQPARWNIQALSPCHLYTINESNYQKIGQLVPGWKDLEKLFLAKCFVVLENRIFNQLSLPAEERYQLLFEENPETFNQVPLQYLASMLGMTPETFSRIRKKRTS
jgi:Cyclic nucleotide-binding domain.